MAKKLNFYEDPEQTDSYKSVTEYLKAEKKEEYLEAKELKKGKKTRRVNLVFTPEGYEKIAEAAQRSGRSLNNFIEYTLLNAIEKEGL